jgi:predicted ATPase
MIYFSNLDLTDWRQFEKINIDLSAQTTILTGANGCGKTSILTVLSHHFGWQLNFVSTPFLSKSKKKVYSEFLKRQSNSIDDTYESIPYDIDESFIPDSNPRNVGKITYSNGGSCTLNTPSVVTSNSQYQLKYSNAVAMDGLYIPSHRPSAVYQKVDSIPTNPKNNAQQYQEYQQLLVQMYNGARANNPGSVMKQSLIALAVFGYGNQAVTENSEYKSIFETFQSVLHAILPTNLGFRKLEIRMPDVVLITRTGDFALDSMSGGINSLFTIAWQILMFGWNRNACTVLIDEPENHLHPSMQRSLLPSLAKAFPKYRFVASTHSPFVVTSDPSAKVFALTYNSNHRIVSHHLEKAELSASPDKVLRDILEVPSIMPIWAEDELRVALQEYQGRSGDKQAMDDLFEKLRSIGLATSIADLPEKSAK